MPVLFCVLCFVLFVVYKVHRKILGFHTFYLPQGGGGGGGGMGVWVIFLLVSSLIGMFTLLFLIKAGKTLIPKNTSESAVASQFFKFSPSAPTIGWGAQVDTGSYKKWPAPNKILILTPVMTSHFLHLMCFNPRD